MKVYKLLHRFCVYSLLILLCGCGKTPKIIRVTAIGIYDEEISLVEGDACEPRYWIEPYEATNKSISWTSEDPTVASITKKGRLYAEKAGTTLITACSDDGGKTASCKVIVLRRAIPVSSIRLNTTSLELAEGETAVLTATISPDNADDPAFSWSTSDPETVSVRQDGSIMANRAGCATVTATSHDGGFEASCSVTVRGGGSNEDYNHRDFDWE